MKRERGRGEEVKREQNREPGRKETGVCFLLIHGEEQCSV